jgi:hypothetical protein
MRDIRRVTISFLLLGLFALIFSCDNKSSPTSPTNSDGVSKSGGYQISFYGAIWIEDWNWNFDPPIKKVECLFDGEVFDTKIYSSPVGSSNCGGSMNNVSSGQHTFSIRIANQTSSPNTYDGGFQILSVIDNRWKSFEYQKMSLATGDSISRTFSLPLE